jgi:porphobilinogen synthase
LSFPQFRPRRLRRTDTLRRMVRETRLSIDRLIYPLFVVPGADVKEEIPSMPGVFHMSVDMATEEARAVADLGIPAVLLFGLPRVKDEQGSEAWAADGAAVSQAEAGADIVAPSDMLDGRVQAIRRALDSRGLVDTAILSYAAKYASAFYGPFREAADSTPQFGDRRGYQMDPANGREALREIDLDLAEGADMVMVKPALPYLDVVHAVKTAHPDVPLAAYNVSGEYAMFKAAAERGWIDERRAVFEALTGIARAGADLLITYYAKDVVRWLREPSALEQVAGPAFSAR